MDGAASARLPTARGRVQERSSMPGVSRLPGHRARRSTIVQRGGSDSNPTAAGLGDHDSQVAGNDVREGGGESGSYFRAADGIRGVVPDPQLGKAKGGGRCRLGSIAGVRQLGGGSLVVRRFTEQTFNSQRQTQVRLDCRRIP
jgi:hypothetical protein